MPFGAWTHGVAAAAHTYFGTTPEDLTVPQAALLAALVSSPAAPNLEQFRRSPCSAATSSSTAWRATAWCAATRRKGPRRRPERAHRYVGCPTGV
nr:transglycosylase domain-containing protein [Lentzea xinjiangensis]